jgi:ribosome biogenesis protein Nip4
VRESEWVSEEMRDAAKHEREDREWEHEGERETEEKMRVREVQERKRDLITIERSNWISWERESIHVSKSSGGIVACNYWLDAMDEICMTSPMMSCSRVLGEEPAIF